MFQPDYLVYLFLLAGMLLSYRAQKLTLAGSVTGGLVGLLVYQGGGSIALILLVLFFGAGTVATRIGKHKKPSASGRDESRRTAGQVLANGGVAALLGLFALILPQHVLLFKLMIAGSLAAATADTLSSELGMLYGRRFYNVLTLRPDTRGLDGVVSLEGTLIGIAGAALIATAYGYLYGFPPMAVIILAGFTGNLADSVLGATLERRGMIGNNLVNFLNTFFGALICWLLY